MSRLIAAVYGVVSYLVFFLTFLYLIGFVSGLLVPKHVDSGASGALLTALLVNLALIALFGVQHSVMARPAFKRRVTQLISPAIERSTFVLAGSVALIVLFWQWRPLTAELWRVDQPIGAMVLLGLQGIGWAMVLVSTFLINHFELFGLRQVYDHLRRRPAAPHRFVTPFLYRIVRHPIMLGFLIAFWATPVMTAGKLLFAAGMTTYILIGVSFEERDLAHTLGGDYEAYRERVPGLVPGSKVFGRKRVTAARRV